MAALTIPKPSVPVTRPDGTMDPDWYRFFLALVALVNGAL